MNEFETLGVAYIVLIGVFAVLHIVLVIWIFQDYEKRGGGSGGGCFWAIFVLIFGLLGLLCYLVARPSVREASQGPIVHVHNPMTPPPLAQAPVEPSRSVPSAALPGVGAVGRQTEHCPGCGSPHEAGARFCVQCGAALGSPSLAQRFAAPAPPAISPAQPPRDRSYRIGRDAGNDITIPQPQVSGTHALLTMTAGTIFLEDLGSTNGTWVNGQRIIGRRQISPGDRIGFGSLILRYEELVNLAPSR